MGPSIVGLLLLAMTAYFIYLVVRFNRYLDGKTAGKKEKAAEKNRQICTQCHTVSSPEFTPRGSRWIELILWCCYLLPGLIYSIWRRAGHKDNIVCPKCLGKTMIPVDTPRGQQLMPK